MHDSTDTAASRGILLVMGYAFSATILGSRRCSSGRPRPMGIGRPGFVVGCAAAELLLLDLQAPAAGQRAQLAVERTVGSLVAARLHGANID
jgi:hypothetical protein